MTKPLLTTYFLSVLCLSVQAKPYKIIVSTQQDFDCLQSNIEQVLKDGSSQVKVYFEKDHYTYSDCHINFANLQYPDAEVTISSKGAVLQCVTERYQSGGDPKGVYVGEDGRYVDLWSEVIQLSDTVRIVDRNLSVCGIPNDFKIEPDGDVNSKYIQVSCWFVSKICPITKVTNDSIYFDAGDYCRYRSEASYNINMNYGYSRQMPRARIFGFRPECGMVNVCKSANLLTLRNCSFKCLVFEGFIIIGGADTKPLFRIDHTQAQEIEVSNNQISSIGGTVLHDNYSQNVHFVNNVVDSYHGHGVLSNNGSKGLVVANNSFSNGSLMWSNYFAIRVSSEDFFVADNVIVNFKYAGIGAGVWHGTVPVAPCCGIIDGNELFYTGSYLSDPLRFTLMDSGAIYTWTQTDGVAIRNNYIHDYTGARSNRGIFCDDGAKNVTITGNFIERIKNSYCIDLRHAPSVAAKIPDYNTGNVCSDNLVDGEIRFYLRDETCRKSGNKKIGSWEYRKMAAYKRWKDKIK